MAWWKESFEKINNELELVKKKRDILEKLLDSGKISQPTYEYYSKELEEAEKEIENRRKSLIEKVNFRMETLEKQLQVLEMLFADIEISHAVGEIDEETYNKQRETLATGLDFARKELESLKEFTANLEKPSIETAEKKISEVEEAVTETVAEEAIEEHIEEVVREPASSEEIETETTMGESAEETQQSAEESQEAPSTTPVEDLTFQAVEEEIEKTKEQIEPS